MLADADDTYQKINTVLNKISKCNEKNNIQKSEKFVENAIDFIAKKRKRLFEEEEECKITPIEKEESADLYFVKKVKQNDDKITWVNCFDAGIICKILKSSILKECLLRWKIVALINDWEEQMKQLRQQSCYKN